ncbi:MAG: 50S ribosomal protein L21 [Chloroflexi bacterium]|nr:50S ribosomal protein L21 [Chloroflexota bacterium]
MKYAIVESGGKQYKAVEGGTIEVDRLPVEAGAKIDLERVLLVADGDNFTVGTPTVDGVQVKASVLAHFKGPKIIIFKYHPKKRYRVKGGHRQQYTRLLIEQIGKAAAKKAAKAAKAETPKKVDAETKAEKVAKAAKASAPAKAKKPAAKKTAETAKPAKSTAAKKPARAKSTKPAAAKKKTTKTAAAKKSTKSTKSTTAAKSSKASTKKTSTTSKTKKSTKK